MQHDEFIRHAILHSHCSFMVKKTIGRAHTPKKLWERVKLPRNYEKALEVIDEHLAHASGSRRTIPVG